MALGLTYKTGTVTVQAGGLNVVGVGTLWTPQIEIGDWLFIAGLVGMVGAITDDTNLTLEAPWQGTLPPSNSTYFIAKMSWLRYDPALTQSKLRELLEDLAAQGTFLFVEAPPTDDMGEDGQWALMTTSSPWRLWYKDPLTHSWKEQPTPAGMRWRGAWSAATGYASGDGVSSAGSSYIAIAASGPPAAPQAPPNATYWNLMAAVGATGATGAAGTPGAPGLLWRGTWAGATAYAKNDGVQYLGASYICITPHTSSGAAPPPNANWNLLAQSGSASIADDTITPQMLDADAPPATKQLAFRDRLNFVSRQGDTMTGPLLLPVGAPAAAQEATSKSYVDGAIINTSVRFDIPQAGTGAASPYPLAELQQSRARYNIFAAPLETVDNLLLNGDHSVSQESVDGVVTALGTKYFTDQWFMVNGCDATMTGQRMPVGGFYVPNLYRVSCTVADASLAAAQYCMWMQIIEGNRIASCGFGTSLAKPIGVAIWLRASVSANMGISFANFDGSRCYMYNFTLGTTGQFYVFTLPPDTGGTWKTDNSAGLYIRLCLAAGNNFLGTPSAPGSAGWSNLPLFGGAGLQGNFCGGAFFVDMASAILLPGVDLTLVEQSVLLQRLPRMFRPYDRELAHCQRFYQKSFNDSVVPGTAPGAGGCTITAPMPSNGGYSTVTLPTAMRIVPNPTFYDGAGTPGKVSYITGVWNNGGAISAVVASQKYLYVQANIVSAAIMNYDFTASARF
jgi:hypothetical protein